VELDRDFLVELIRLRDAMARIREQAEAMIRLQG